MKRRRARLSGWSASERTAGDWRRNRDWTGWHTTLGAVFGIAVAVLVAALLGGFSLGPEVPDLVDDPLALEERYAEDWAAAFEPARAVAYAERMQQLAADERDPWAIGFRAGWVDARREVVAAMHRAAVEQDLGEYRVEWQVLERLQRSLSP